MFHCAAFCLSLQPSTPSAAAERVLASDLSTTGDSLAASSTSLSWSLWDQSNSRGSSFYEQLQAAASDGFPGGGGSGHTIQLPSPAFGADAPLYNLPLAPGVPVQAPFPGQAPHGMGLSLGFASQPVTLPSRASLDAEVEMQQLLAAVASMATQDG